MVDGVFSWVDLVMGPLTLFIIAIIAFIVVKLKYEGTPFKKHFYWGLGLKLIGCFGFIIVYALYYKRGDTFNYYADAAKIIQLALKNPTVLFQAISVDRVDPHQMNLLNSSTRYHLAYGSDNYTVIKFAIVFGLLTMKSYLSISLLFSFVSFIGIWMLYRTVVNIFPKSVNIAAIPIFYIPSVFFWGSSLMKDSVVLGFLGMLTYGIYKFFFARKRLFASFLIILFSSYVLSSIKEYVIIAFVPSVILWLSLGPISRLSTALRFLLYPFLLLVGLATIYLAIPFLEQLTTQYTLETILETAQTSAEYVYRTTREGGSSYSLDIEYTFSGIIKAFPKAVNVTLFRPYIWEVRNPVMLISALESMCLFLLTIFVLLKVGIFRFFSCIFNNPFLLTCLVFSVFLAFAIGISTFNFGSLVRYKLPCIPFYGIALLIPYAINKSQE